MFQSILSPNCASKVLQAVFCGRCLKKLFYIYLFPCVRVCFAIFVFIFIFSVTQSHFDHSLTHLNNSMIESGSVVDGKNKIKN